MSTPPQKRTWSIDWTTNDGHKIRYGIYHNGPPDAITACVVIINGRSEWIEKYDYLLDELNLPPGCAILSWDHRGQGGSSGHRSHIESYCQYARDAAAVIQEAIQDKPYLLVGHSMGGLIALYASAKQYLTPREIVLTSPLLRMPDQPIPASVARNISRAVAWGPFKRVSTPNRSKPIDFHENKLTHCPTGFDLNVNTPWAQPSPSMSWVKHTFAACDQIFDREHIAQLRASIRIFGATDEAVVNKSGLTDWVQLAKEIHICNENDGARQQDQIEIELQWIEGAYHELLNETPSLRATIIDYIQQQTHAMAKHTAPQCY